MIYDFAAADAVQRYVNTHVRYMPDIQKYGKPEWWANAIKDGGGFADCEDYVIAKVEMLLEAGWPRDQVGFWICYGRFDTGIGGHAVGSVIVDGREWIADNNYPGLERYADLPYQWVKRWDFGKRGFEVAQSWKDHPVIMT